MLRLFYYMSDLKQLRKYWESKIQYPEQRQLNISQNNIPEELTTISNTRNQIDQNLEQLKYNNFWTQPYSNFQGKQAVDLANNLTKEATYTAAGELLLGKLAQGVNKLIPKKTNRYKARFDENGQPIEQKLDNKLEKLRDDEVLDSYYYVREQWNGDKNLRLSEKDHRNIDIIKLNPDIKKRLESAMVDYNQQEVEYLLLENSNIGIGNNKQLTSLLGRPNKERYFKYIKENPDSRGVIYHDGNNNFDIYIKKELNDKLLSRRDIAGTSAHEAAHQMQKVYNISYDIPHGKYLIANPELKISREISKYVKIDSNWAKSINEVDADLWKFRRLHNLGARDLTTDEIKQFLNEYGDRHFEMDKIDDNLVKWIQKLAAINVFSTKDK